MSMNWRAGEDIVVLGARGSGKTVFLHNVFYQSEGVIAYNMLREAGFLYLADAYIRGDRGGIPELRKAVRSGRYKRICYIPDKATVMSVESIRREYSYVLTLAYERGNMTVINDDIGYICQGETMTDAMQLSTLWGRHRNMTHAYAAQRNQLIPKTMVTQASHWVVYWIQDYDCWAWSKFLGADLHGLCAQLKPYEYIHFHGRDTKICPPVPLLVDERAGKTFVDKPMPVDAVEDMKKGGVT